ncbi:hypothetical protein [Actinotignum sp. GS-2025b]
MPESTRARLSWPGMIGRSGGSWPGMIGRTGKSCPEVDAPRR